MIMTPNWYLNKLAHAGPEHLDAAYVAGYDRKAGFNPTDELAQLCAAGLDHIATLLDLGAGTGKLALAAAAVCRRVIAVDVSPAMLAIVRREAARRGLHDVECIQSGFLSYAHAGKPVDFVYSRHALHQLPDFWKAIALQRMAAMLRPGGVLRVRDLFLSCPLEAVHEVVEAWLARAAETSEVGWTRGELESHLRDEYSTFTWLFEPMLAQAGFEVRDATFSESRIYASYTCVRAH